MINKKLILEIKEKLDKLLEDAPSEEELGDEYAIIEFYADAQNLKETIENLNISNDIKTGRNPKQGLYPEEVAELMNYIQKNNSWQNMLDCYNRHREIPKYYTMRVDTRTGTVWSIEFDHLIYDRTSESFRTEQNYNFKKAIYEFLDRERKKDDA
jgi:hypothetical protein